MNKILIKTSYFVVQKLIFKQVKAESWKKICLKHFSLQKSTKNKPFVQKQPPETFFKGGFLKRFHQVDGKTPVLDSLFNKDSDLRPVTLLRKGSNKGVFFFTDCFPTTSLFCNSSHSFIL